MKKIYEIKEIAETIENYESLVGSLDKVSDNVNLNKPEHFKKDAEGYFYALILSKKMYYEIKSKIEFVDKCLKSLKDKKEICIVEARLKGLEYNYVRKHYQIHDHTIRRIFDKIVIRFYDSQFDVPPNRKRKRRTKAELEAAKKKDATFATSK